MTQGLAATENLEFEGVSFGYGRSPVLSGFSWKVRDGKTVLLGPNGAGKTTLLGLAATVIAPWSGTIRIGNLNANRSRKSYRAISGWMPQVVRAVPGLSVLEQVAYAAWLKGVPRSRTWEAATQALDQVELSAKASDVASTLSGGQLRRVGLAQAIVHKPRILILDEPTVGLDPAQRARFRELIRGLPSDQYQVVVSTHQVDDLSELFDTVAVLAAGQLRHESGVQEFVALGGERSKPAEAAYASVIGIEDS